MLMLGREVWDLWPERKKFYGKATFFFNVSLVTLLHIIPLCAYFCDNSKKKVSKMSLFQTFLVAHWKNKDYPSLKMWLIDLTDTLHLGRIRHTLLDWYFSCYKVWAPDRVFCFVCNNDMVLWGTTDFHWISLYLGVQCNCSLMNTRRHKLCKCTFSLFRIKCNWYLHRFLFQICN